MKEKGILFSAPMVRALLREIDPKTQTRRMVKPQPESRFQHLELHRDGTLEVGVSIDSPNHYQLQCPYPIGTRVYVKETHQRLCGTCYRATGHSKSCLENGARHDWIPSIFMPKRLARIWLEITAVRVERLQDISEEDAKAEGVPFNLMASTHRLGYENLWNTINGPGSWDLNPWVWAYTFRRIEK